MEEKVRILVVDDDRRMVKTVCDILKVKGYESLEAYTGEEAVEKVRSQSPACVLMDIKMPGINGVVAVKRIKDVSPDLPVLLMSAYATEKSVEEAKENGAYTVLTKPVDIQMLLSFLALLRKEESILVVDDDPAFCRTLKDILEARGYCVQTECDPERVIGDMEEGSKLAVILDLKIGNTNGLEVLKKIRARYPSKTVILVTGYREEMKDTIEKGLKIGAYTCLYKPFEMDELINAIREISKDKYRSALEKGF